MWLRDDIKQRWWSGKALPVTRGVASKALKAGFSFLIWREALSSEEPVGGASGFGVMDGRVAVFTPQHLFLS